MNINRNNYEEYFLLYADNELSKPEKKVVEIFVQENPDLKEEFLMIQMTVNFPEKEIKLLDKSFLLKKELPFINENNYEEIFVLYYDNELSEEQRFETENFIAANSQLKNEFELIGKAKLVSQDSIVYPDKKELYRKEKSGKVIPLILRRSIAAAVFIGFGIWISVSYFNQNKTTNPIAIVNNQVKKPVIKETKPDTNIVREKPLKEENNIASSAETKGPKRIQKDETEIRKPVLKEEKINEPSIAKTDKKTKVHATVEKIKTVKTEDKYQLAKINEPVKELPGKMIVTENSLANNSKVKQPGELDPDVPKPNYAHTASYISDADQKNDNYVFYDVSLEKFNKSKVGGFLKKVKRIVERTNPIARLLGEEDQLAAK